MRVRTELGLLVGSHVKVHGIYSTFFCHKVWIIRNHRTKSNSNIMMLYTFMIMQIHFIRQNPGGEMLTNKSLTIDPFADMNIIPIVPPII